MKTSLGIFLPAFNVSNSLEKLLAEFSNAELVLNRHGYKLSVLVINDNSTDGTGDMLERANLSYDWLQSRRNERNAGNAANIVSGYKWGVENKFDIIGCMDADGEHSPYAMIRHLEMIKSGEFDGIAGSIIFPDHDANYHDRNMMRFWGGMQAATAGIDGVFYIQSPGYNLHKVEHVQKALELFNDYQKFFIESTVSSTLSEEMLDIIPDEQRNLLLDAAKKNAEKQFPRWGMHGVIIYLMAVGSGSHIKAVYLECFGHSPNRTSDKLSQQANAANTHGMMLAKFLSKK